MTRIATIILCSVCATAFGDTPPNGAFRVQSTTLNLTVMDQMSVAREPQDCFLFFHDSSMVLLFRHVTPTSTQAEGTIWKIGAFDQNDSNAIGYVQRVDSRARHKMRMNWAADGKLGIELIDDVRRVRGLHQTVQFECEACDNETARQALSEILETKPLRLAPQARETLLAWLKKQDGEP